MIYVPLWMQKADPGDDDIEYSARQDRQLIALVLDEGLYEGGEVHERAAGATFDVEVEPFVAVVDGDGAAGQGAYLVISDEVEPVTMPPAPGANSRIDLIVLQINDDQVDGGGVSNAELVAVEGVAGAVPVAPDVPDSALYIKQVLVTAAHVSIEDADISGEPTTASVSRIGVGNYADLPAFDKTTLRIFHATDARARFVNSGTAWEPVNEIASMTTLQRNALPAGGKWADRIIWNSTDGAMQRWTGVAWVAVASVADAANIGVSAAKNADQNITSGSDAPLSFQTELWDTNAFHDNVTNNTRLTVPVGQSGIYLAMVTIKVTTGGSVLGPVEIYWTINGSTQNAGRFRLASSALTASAAHYFTASALFSLTAGDILEVYASNAGTGATITIGGASNETLVQLRKVAA